MRRVLGIDLGTTYSAMAVVGELGKPEIITNREGERITPSVVLFQGAEPIVGTLASRSAMACPQDVVQFVKRQMGNPAWEFVTSEGQAFRPEEISALILQRLRKDAEEMTGHTFDRAVITVPAYFNDAQRKATQDAGRIAGLEVLRVLNEPTAAALAFGIDSSSTGTVLVYDLGGGTFDVTVMRVEAGELEVLATGGDRNLGGFDWDNATMNWLNERFMAAGGSSLLEDPSSQAAQDLREKAEMAKRTLSQGQKAMVMLSHGGVTERIELARQDFEAATSDLLERTQMHVDMTLEDAGLDWPAIDRLLLVGGSTRMPAVTQLVESISGKTPERNVNPDEIVAMGAAIVAELLDTESERLDDVDIQDVTSHGLGTVVLRDGRPGTENSIIIPRNTPIPSQRSRVYYTVEDQQSAVEVEITEGDDIELDYVCIVGTSTVPIPAYPADAPIEIFLDFDANGIIGVSVVDLTANKPLGTFTVDRQANLSGDEIEASTRRLSTMEVS